METVLSDIALRPGTTVHAVLTLPDSSTLITKTLNVRSEQTIRS